MDAVEVMKGRILVLEEQRASVKEQLELQIEGHLRPYDVAINEIKSLLIQLGEAVPMDVAPTAPALVLQPVRPQMSRASNPTMMLRGDSITADQAAALERARDKSPELQAAVIAANPVNQLKKAIAGQGD